ncbi:FkbM family methyltransferase [Pseudoprimorskyibacter insulae]|uniref:Methyltransferase small domain-containing protein n=1 Tax=Pseudoprimorskyibacter insulae TaxID=1695997 RepID=A0A2R8AWS4_9RHOB|nr:FkbM family methyltransferase [Pseudoprimorskyibacter insulae]SPF80496.1 hypothetical protein PRI8871_02306 [Pseudoprimorskyibacter insulae]
MDAIDMGVEFVKSRGMYFPKAPFLTGRPRKALRLGTYDHQKAEAALRVIRSDDRVLELGAGIGFLSTLLATKRQVQSIHCYDANPKLVRYIREVHVANGVVQAQVHNAVLSAEAGDPVPFYERDHFLDSSLDASDEPPLAEHQVTRATLAEAMETARPTALISDLSGAEAKVLIGTDLTALRLAIIELDTAALGQTGVQTIFDTMADAGLTYFPRASDKKVVTFLKGW